MIIEIDNDVALADRTFLIGIAVDAIIRANNNGDYEEVFFMLE